MKRLLSSFYLILGCRLLLAGLFMWAAIPKIMDPSAFATSIDNYHFLPTILVNLWAMTLPWVELLVGIILILAPSFRPPLDALTEGAALLSTLMYLSFFIALSWALAHGFDINCGCFAQNGIDKINWWYLLRDGSLFLISLLVLFNSRQPV